MLVCSQILTATSLGPSIYRHRGLCSKSAPIFRSDTREPTKEEEIQGRKHTPATLISTNHHRIIASGIQLRMQRRRTRRIPIRGWQEGKDLLNPIHAHGSIPLARVPVLMLDPDRSHRGRGAGYTAEFDGSVFIATEVPDRFASGAPVTGDNFGATRESGRFGFGGGFGGASWPGAWSVEDPVYLIFLKLSAHCKKTRSWVWEGSDGGHTMLAVVPEISLGSQI